MTAVDTTESVVRYARPNHVNGDTINGGAFVLRAIDEGALSVNRPAVFDESVSKSLVEIRKLARLTVKKSGRYAQLEVSQLSAAAADMQEVNELIVLEDSLAQTEHHLADPSHAIVVGLPQHDSPFAELCGDLLAQRVVAVYPAIA